MGLELPGEVVFGSFSITLFSFLKVSFICFRRRHQVNDAGAFASCTVGSVHHEMHGIAGACAPRGINYRANNFSVALLS